MPPNTGGADVAPADLGGAVRGDQRQDAEDEGDRGHHHGAEPHLGAERRGVADRRAALALLLGELDDQDAVLGGERDQHDQPDLGVEVEGQAGDHDAAKAPRAAGDDDSSTGIGITQLS
jgi:hypothetical protein